MAETMQAFVMHGIGKVGFMEKPVPDPGPTDAIIKTTKALICTSDTHTVAGAIGERTDLTLGHEAVGVVAKVGSAVRGVQEGDRVAVHAITPCYTCMNCLRGYSSQCQQLLGGWKFANMKDGVFATYSLPHKRLWRHAGGITNGDGTAKPGRHMSGPGLAAT
jgi:threonine dehydrogenase-like Zn-dependent dehydrogenase